LGSEARPKTEKQSQFSFGDILFEKTFKDIKHCGTTHVAKTPEDFTCIV
jgi:hypothetical protein